MRLLREATANVKGNSFAYVFNICEITEHIFCLQSIILLRFIEDNIKYD